MASNPQASRGEPQANVVQITVIPGPRVARRPSGMPIRPRVIAAVAVSLVAVLAAALLLGTSLIGGHARTGVSDGPVQVPLRGTHGVAAAYAYPLRCLSVSIALHDPRFVRADFDRLLPCDVDYSTAVFRRVHGRWVPVLGDRRRSCHARSLPWRVQWDLAVCAAELRQHAGP
jgi:hypothetical protein